MLECYWGEFLVSPCPLELSLNLCSNGCTFCFSTHSNPDRRPDVRALMRLLASYPRRQTLCAELLKGSYPVVVSNKTDPFAKSNYRQTLAILAVLTACGIPVTLQTRGGHGVDEALGILPPSVWYVSLGTLDEGLRRRLEPGATSVPDRLALMRAVKAAGHRVVVGYNPCVPEWQPDPAALLLACREAGCEGVWVEPLHLNQPQEEALTAREREALTEPIIRRARKRRRAPQDFEHVLAARAAAEALGLAVFTGGQPTRSDFWRPWRETYPATFPTMQDWVNALHDAGRAGGTVAFSEFSEFVLGRLPDVPASCRMDGRRYLLRSIRNHLWRDHPEWGPGMRFADVLGALWTEPRTVVGPLALPCFAYAGRRTGDGWEPVVGEDGMPLLVFGPAEVDGYFAEV